MSLLGKILLFVNLLAAGALVFLSSQSWAKRQELNGIVLRFVLVRDGVPLDDPKTPSDDTDEIAYAVTVAPGSTTTTVSKKLLDAHFGGPAPKSQVDEVKAAKNKIETTLAGMADDAAKLRYLCGARTGNQYAPGFLTPYADSYEERAAIRALGTAKTPDEVAANLKEARRRFDRKFDAVINKPEPAKAQADAAKLADYQAKVAADPKDAATAAELATLQSEGAPDYARDEADRRVRTAQVLMLINPTSDGQKRVVLVVGLKAYLAAVSEQTTRLEEVLRRVVRQTEQDQARFQDEYELLKRLAVEQDQLLYQQTLVLSGLKDLAAKDAEAVKLRTTQLDELKVSLNGVTTEVAKLLADQAKVEGDLFAVQKRVGETLRGNFSLEEKLLKTEEAKR